MTKELSLLFLTPHIPALPTLSVGLPNGRTVTQQLGDEEIVRCHEELTSETREVLRRSLILLRSSHLRFVGPPVVERKRQVEDELRAQAAKYTRLQDLVIARWHVIATQMTAFYEEYAAQVRHRRPTALDVAQVRSRFTLSWSWLPVDLPKELADQMFSVEEQAEIHRQIEEAARQAVAGKVEGYLREMVTCLDTMAAALREKHVASRKTIGRMMAAYREVAAIVPHTRASDEEAERVRQFGQLIADMEEARLGCDRKKTRPAAMGALADAVEAARREAAPMLDAWAGEMPELEVPDVEDAEVAQGAGAIAALLGAELDAEPELATA